MIKVCDDFENRCGIPNVLGALDCTLIKIASPGGDTAERFRSRKSTFALNVQTLSDVELSIRNLVVRWPGSTHDSTILDHSYLRAHLEVDLQEKYVVLGDSGYPLRSYLMTPFLNPANIHQRRFNTAQILGRNVVERQYGVWKRRFRCIDSKLRCRLDNAQKIIIATAVLHNIAIGKGDNYAAADDYEDDDVDSINYDQTNGGVARRNAIVAARFTF
ncbi:hypothetical protein JTE90_004727 [Oedothorax gibbosus]|uniref:DDE Tnp4 domain-containing protein n=1 Tax=Oedothorax gibbosus TaxID=931172 RepID=A0AAV6TP49_9ARAC|nr:hypothetical protein JTE90_004727 [Oedothorax gibbosus]